MPSKDDNKDKIWPWEFALHFYKFYTVIIFTWDNITKYRHQYIYDNINIIAVNSSFNRKLLNRMRILLPRVKDDIIINYNNVYVNQLEPKILYYNIYCKLLRYYEQNTYYVR